jgi:hypothetical protein
MLGPGPTGNVSLWQSSSHFPAGWLAPSSRVLSCVPQVPSALHRGPRGCPSSLLANCQCQPPLRSFTAPPADSVYLARARQVSVSLWRSSHSTLHRYLRCRPCYGGISCALGPPVQGGAPGRHPRPVPCSAPLPGASRVAALPPDPPLCQRGVFGCLGVKTCGRENL